MCRFIETIRIENGEICNVSYHNARLNETRRCLLGETDRWDIASLLNPEKIAGRVRCRLTYGKELLGVEYFSYTPRQVGSLQLVEADSLLYAFKYADRSGLDEMFSKRGEADDVLMVRNGLLTDTSIANIALWNGTEWHTPSLPLLKGTCRQRLLDEGIIVEREIRADQLGRYTEICLFNAMLSFGEIQFKCDRIKGL